MLGCTHYPLLAGVLQIVLGPDVTLVSSAEETGQGRRPGADGARPRPRARRRPAPAPHEFLATGDPEPFRRLGRRFLGPEIGAVAALGVAPGRRRPLRRDAPLRRTPVRPQAVAAGGACGVRGARWSLAAV